MSGLFGSAILDVAVGLIFVYLLVSLVVSAASELIASMLKWRAKNLWQGINNLLRDRGEAGGNKKTDFASLADALYDHPLIRRLAQPGKKPSYIPSRTFALVLLDIVSNPAKYIKIELLKLTDGIENAETKKSVQGKITEILDSGKPMDQLRTDLIGLISGLPNGEVKTKLNGLLDKIPANPTGVGGLIDAFPNEDVKRMLRVLWDESGRNIEKLKENVEIWFNNSMDRVSGWYKRKSQAVNFIIAIVIAILLNIDSETIARRLSTDSTLRTALAAQAEEFAKEPSNRPAQPQTTTTQQAAGAQPPAAPTGQTPAGQTPAGQTPPTGTTTTSPSTADLQKEFEERKKAVDDSIKQIKSLGLPIGWMTPQEKKEKEEREKQEKEKQAQSNTNAQGTNAEGAKSAGSPIYEPPEWPGWALYESKVRGDWGNAFSGHGLGWLFTAIAASLGAPFWFDILNKIITIRSAGKAPEETPKSPKEEPKPLGPAETPEEKRAEDKK